MQLINDFCDVQQDCLRLQPQPDFSRVGHDPNAVHHVEYMSVYTTISYCGWLRNPNHQLIGSFFHYL